MASGHNSGVLAKNGKSIVMGPVSDDSICSGESDSVARRSERRVRLVILFVEDRLGIVTCRYSRQVGFLAAVSVFENCWLLLGAAHFKHIVLKGRVLDRTPNLVSGGFRARLSLDDHRDARGHDGLIISITLGLHIQILDLYF